jgi:hypothetical protein
MIETQNLWVRHGQLKSHQIGSTSYQLCLTFESVYVYYSEP